MSWSVNANGTPEQVKSSLKEQFSCPLAEGDAGLPDEGEKETVRKVSDLIDQCLGTFDPGHMVSVSASGHMGFTDYDSKQGAYQSVSLTIS